MNEIPINEKAALPLGEKYALTIKEAAIYFNIGNKKLGVFFIFGFMV